MEKLGRSKFAPIGHALKDLLVLTNENFDRKFDLSSKTWITPPTCVPLALQHELVLRDVGVSPVQAGRQPRVEQLEEVPGTGVSSG